MQITKRLRTTIISGLLAATGFFVPLAQDSTAQAAGSFYNQDPLHTKFAGQPAALNRRSHMFVAGRTDQNELWVAHRNTHGPWSRGPIRWQGSNTIISVTADPGVVMHKGVTHIFARGNHGNMIMSVHQDGFNYLSTDLGIPIEGTPSMVEIDGKLHGYARRPDGGILTFTLSDTGVIDAEDMVGHRTDADPSVYAMYGQEHGVFVKSGDELWVVSIKDGYEQSNLILSGIKSAPTAINHMGDAHVMVQSTEDTYIHLHYRGLTSPSTGAWSGYWSDLGGNLNSQPAAVSYEGEYFAFGVGEEQSMSRMTWTHNFGWGGSQTDIEMANPPAGLQFNGRIFSYFSDAQNDGYSVDFGP